ncbi:MAG: bile acid:sodium symporter family protein [Verrucomicrobiales bacterium]
MADSAAAIRTCRRAKSLLWKPGRDQRLGLLHPSEQTQARQQPKPNKTNQIVIVKVALPLILAFIMFSLGLGLRGRDFGRVVKFPRAFGAGLLNQVVLLPLVALGLAHAFGLSPEFAVGLMILALCPGGVTSNVLARLARGNTPLSISLTAVTSLLSVVTVPFLVAFSVAHFMGDRGPEVNVTQLGLTMFLITAVPVAIGMAITAKSPALVERIAPGISRAAIALFVLIIVAALAKNWDVFYGNLGTLGPVAILLNLIMLGAGIASSRAAGLDHSDATTISIESGVQNGTLAIAVGGLVAGVGSEVLPPVTVPAAVYSITMYLVCVPFVFWRRRRRTPAPAGN